MTRFHASLLAASTTFISASSFAGDALSIRDVAPENAILVVGADDVRGTIDRLGATAYGRLWNDPAIAEEVRKFREQIEKGIVDAAAEAGIAREDVTWPSSLGLAVLADVDEELGLPSMQFVFFCDWSADAEKSAKMLEAMMERAEKTAKERGTEVKTEEVRGRRVMVSKLGDAAEDGDGMDGGDGMDEQGGGMGFGGPSLAPSEMCLAVDGGRLFAASSTGAMDMLLGRVDGDRAKPVGDAKAFKGAMELAGGTQDLYAVIQTEPIQPLLATMPPFMLVEPLIKRFFGDIQAWSIGMQAREGVFEAGFGVYVPDGKVGLLALVDAPGEAKAPPAIVPADALSYGRLNVRFDRIMSVLDDAIAGLPPDQSEMIKPQLDMYRPAMSAAFAAMGPEVHIWAGETDKEDPLSGTTVTAIAMRNDKESAAAVVDFINLLPLGLQARDFNGMTILSDEFAPFAVGIGGGYLMLGPVKKVEQAMRQVDAKGDAGLAGDAQFASAMAELPKSPLVGMAWWNTARMMSDALSTAQMALQQVAAMGGGGLDEAEVPGVGVGLDEVGGFMSLLKPEVVKRCFGDTLLDFSSTPDGFRTRYRMMPAAETK